MFRLASIFYAFISATLGGVGVVAVLVAGLETWQAILGAAALGYLIAIPVTMMVARMTLNAVRTS